jgi:putative transposase
MSRKHFSAEEIVNKLRQADVELARGKTGSVVCRQIGVTDQTYFRWRKEYGGLNVDQAKRFKKLEQEDGRLIWDTRAAKSYCMPWGSRGVAVFR